MNQPLQIHLGPVMPGWGSWEWLGQEMIPEFARYAEVSTFTYDHQPPTSGVIFIIKHPPPVEWQQAIQSRQLSCIYAPVDYYDSVRSIDADAQWLCCLDHIVIHCHRLLPYFIPYGPVTYIDHQLRFITKKLVVPKADGPILWVGVRSNLPPLMEWLRRRVLPRPLVVLTNLEGVEPVEVGFPANQPVTIECWTPERHLSVLHEVSAALDIRGDDFRSRHKPPTKAMDFLACGLPFAVSLSSSISECLEMQGFSPANPDDDQRWLSPKYLSECQRFAIHLRDKLTRKQVALIWVDLLKQVSSK